MGYVHYYKFLDPENLERNLTSFRNDLLLIVEAADVPLDLTINESSNIQSNSIRSVCFTGRGDDGHEEFVIPPADNIHHDQLYCTKTNRKPYDLTVCVVLLRLKSILAENLDVSSDGDWDEPSWTRARSLYQMLWPGDTITCPWQQGKSEVKKMDAQVISTGPKCSSTSHNMSAIPSSAPISMAVHDSTPAHADLKEALKLISVCSKESQSHQTCIPEPVEWYPFDGVRFRVVDTVSHCIVEPSQIPKYVALSYVWGKSPQLQLVSSNRTKLMCEGALLSEAAAPSQTILDAMRVCRLLDLRYLWVDALCILQDESRDRTIQILRMRRIYSGSFLTIVAACGEDSTSGMKFAMPKSTSHDGNVCTTSEWKIYKGSVWKSRGWTLQEAALSHRVLMFTPIGLYFSCQKFAHCAAQRHHSCANRFGGQTLDFGPEMTFLRTSRALNNSHSQLKAYFDAASDYSGRELSDPTDLINAFKGILQYFEPRMDGLKNTFHYGLPLSAFDQAFCWQTQWHCPLLRRPEYPTWSWLGWKSAVFWGRQHYDSDLKDRSAILLWPRLTEWQWQIQKWELDAEATRGYVSHPTLAHQYRDRPACADQHHSSDDQNPRTFCWGLPVASSINHQSDTLWLIGSVTKLSVTLTEEYAYGARGQFDNRKYLVTIPGTGHRIGTILLDEKWRDSQPALLRFMLADGVVNRKSHDGDFKMLGTHLLCYQREQGASGQPEGDDSFSIVEFGSRVQLLECRITEELWREAGAVRIHLVLS